MSYYEILEVVESASPDEIRAAYLRLVQAHHPDRHVGESSDPARLRFKEIQEAYEVLYDPEQRRLYDNGRSIPRPRDRGTVVTPPNRSASSATQPITPGARRDVPDEWLRRKPRRKPRRPFRMMLVIAAIIGLAVTVVPQCSQYLEQAADLREVIPANSVKAETIRPTKSGEPEMWIMDVTSKPMENLEAAIRPKLGGDLFAEIPFKFEEVGAEDDFQMEEIASFEDLPALEIASFEDLPALEIESLDDLPALEIESLEDLPALTEEISSFEPALTGPPSSGQFESLIPAQMEPEFEDQFSADLSVQPIPVTPDPGLPPWQPRRNRRSRHQDIGMTSGTSNNSNFNSQFANPTQPWDKPATLTSPSNIPTQLGQRFTPPTSPFGVQPSVSMSFAMPDSQSFHPALPTQGIPPWGNVAPAPAAQHPHSVGLPNTSIGSPSIRSGILRNAPSSPTFGTPAHAPSGFGPGVGSPTPTPWSR